MASSEYYADLQIVQTALTPHVLGSPRRDPPGADSAYVLNRGAGGGGGMLHKRAVCFQTLLGNKVNYLTRKCTAAGDCDEDWLRNRDVMLVVGENNFLPGYCQGWSPLVRFSDGAGGANTALTPREQNGRKTFVFERQ